MCAGFASNLVGFTRMVNILRHGLNYATRSVRTARDSVASVSATIKRALFASHNAQRGASAPGAMHCGGSSRNAVAPLLDDACTAFGIILKPNAASALPGLASVSAPHGGSTRGLDDTSPKQLELQPRHGAKAFCAQPNSVHDSASGRCSVHWQLPKASDVDSRNSGAPLDTQHRERALPASAPGGLDCATPMTGRPIVDKSAAHVDVP